MISCDAAEEPDPRAGAALGQVPFAAGTARAPARSRSKVLVVPEMHACPLATRWMRIAPEPGRVSLRACCPSTMTAAPSLMARGSAPAMSTEVGPVTQQLAGAIKALTGRFRHASGPSGLTAGPTGPP